MDGLRPMGDKARTMGEAVDWAVENHGKVYPGSEVHSAKIISGGGDFWIVTVEATHFSEPLNYSVARRV